MNRNQTAARFAAAAAALAISLPAMAHPGHAGAADSFFAGLLHPLTGLDHLLAMLAAGVWSARQQRGGRELLPAFLGMMLLGALSVVAGLRIPGLQTGIAATVALSGCLLAAAVRMPSWAGAALLGLFAVLHGSAHGHELPQAASAAGFMLASALLLWTGRAIGKVSAGGVLRLAGAAIAAAGVALMAL
ncbi:HupE/UreJ family protein [Pseudoduganella rhizocola]|uniref:HupE/UreJ family protein n=1 Tax=Pseudoduganella rhizocola TaxID=3382643 RepID=UPI0038B4E0C2